MDVELELVALDQGGVIHSLQQSLVSKTYRAMDYRAIYTAIHEHLTYLITTDDHAVCGFLILKDEGDHIVLDEFGIIAQYRGQGIGTVALEMMLDFENVKGRRVELFTHPDNPAAHLYERNGFQEVERIPDYYGDGEPRMRMVRAPRMS